MDEKLKSLSEKMAASAARLEPWRQLTRQLFVAAATTSLALAVKPQLHFREEEEEGGKGGSCRKYRSDAGFIRGLSESRDNC